MLAVIVDGGNVLDPAAGDPDRRRQHGRGGRDRPGASRCAGARDAGGCGWDAQVAAKVAQSASANNIDVEAAYYTDICGIPLQARTAPRPSTPDGTENLAAAPRRSAIGSLPGGTPRRRTARA